MRVAPTPDGLFTALRMALGFAAMGAFVAAGLAGACGLLSGSTTVTAVTAAFLLYLVALAPPRS